MRSALYLFIWLVLSLIAPEAQGQRASTIEPYEVLYGRPLATQLRRPTQKMVPSEGTLALVQARTDALLARVSSVSAVLGPSPSKQSLRDLAKTVHQEESAAIALRDRGKHYAAWRKASQDFLLAEFLTGFVEAVAKEAVQETSGGIGSLSKMPEVRARLDQFYTRLQLVRPSSVSVVLALAEAYSGWVDATSLLDLVQNHPTELLAMLEPHWGTVSPDKREQFVRWVLEPIAAPLLQWIIDDAELRLQASQSDPPSVLRPGESDLRRLARAYARAASANRSLAADEIEGSRLPPRTPKQQAVGRLSYVLTKQQLDYAHSHQNDVGMSGVLANLGVSAAAYRASLDELAELRVLASPQVAAASEGGDVAVAISRVRTMGMQMEELHVLDAAAQIQAAVGYVPTPILLAYQRAQELQDGDADDQELAQSEQIDATVLAQLAAGLASPPPRSAFPAAEDGTNVGAIVNRDDYIVGCIEKLQFEITGQATGYLINRDPQVPTADREEMIRGAILNTCTRARDLRRDVKPLFWDLLKKSRVNRFRAVQVLERNAPKLTDTCADEPSPEQDLMGHEQCGLAEQAMAALTSDERQVLDLRYTQNLPYEQVGLRLNIDKDTARQRVNRALQRVREFYKKLADPLSQRLPARGLFWHELWALLRHRNPAGIGAKCPDLRELQKI